MNESTCSNSKKNQYKIIPIFKNNEKKIDDVIKSAFIKYLNYNDYK